MMNCGILLLIRLWVMVLIIATNGKIFGMPTSLPPKFVILGGTGKIGTAVASHLLKQEPSLEVVLVGRRGGEAAVQEVQQSSHDDSKISYEYIEDIWNGSSLLPLFKDATGVIHTAGPYSEQSPTVLDAAIESKVSVYVDVSDPLPFLVQSLKRSDAAIKSGTSALCAAGAFPGMSNVLAMEAASKHESIKDVRFNYFTKGLGGSGTINLYITNIGFGDSMNQYDNGEQRAFQNLSGRLLGTVDFFLDNINQKGNDEARERVGTQKVFAWPFPEASTVASKLKIKGSSSAAMGTAPDVWNDMLGILVRVVPRPWWRSKKFSKFMADFSQPLVLFTDAFMRKFSPDNVGETHAMRVDVVSSDNAMTSIVQAHESFRQCVGQSCAEFALDLWKHPSLGVSLPEQRYQNASDRQRIIEKLTSTPGTFCFTGPVEFDSSYGVPTYPTRMEEALISAKADKVEQ